MGIMKTLVRGVAVLGVCTAAQVMLAQAPAGAPAGATGVCKDGSYWTGASKQGACRGHKGVQTWYAAGAAPAAAAPAKPATPAAPVTPAKPATPAPAAAAAPAPAKGGPAAKAASMTQAAGGGPSLVWVNSSSNVYHCYGSTYYGKTKAGSYMSEADAKAKGAHADHGKACSK